MRFDPNLVIGCGSRCKFGKIQVLICRPVTGGRELRPFPTTFWLSCPHLMRLAGTIESHGGVRELEKWLIKNNKFKQWRDYNILHQKIRLNLLNYDTKKFLSRFKPEIFKRLRRGGIGGIDFLSLNKNIYVKCLHLQIASWLALDFHPAAEWLKVRGLNSECDNCLCGYV